MAQTAPRTGNSESHRYDDTVLHQSGRDLEAAQPSASDSEHATKADPHLVTWDGADDPENPKNWTTKQKWIMTVLISTYNFISPVSSTMAAPALATLGADLHMRSEIEVEMALSIFVLAYAIGPLFFGPLSEVYGRSRIIQLSNIWFLAWNLGCGFAQNSAEFFVFRFLAGIGGSAPLAIGAGMLGWVQAVLFLFADSTNNSRCIVTAGRQRNEQKPSAFTCSRHFLALSLDR